MKKSKTPNPNKVESLYIHIPFCRKKCDYCDFISFPNKEHLIDQYVKNIIKEIHCFDFGFLILDLNTIYIGGGTPTLLESAHFENIISSIICHLSLDVCHSEITVEANPGTADKQKLKALKELGVNRLSIGIQSFNDKHLRTLGRIHNSSEALQFYEDARSVGFDNINLDLIFALPGQTLEEWKVDLNLALSLVPEHISAYNLTIEEHTPFALRITDYELPSNETEADMYEYTIETLTSAGYRHYEISNFARPGFECQHNLVYWRNGNYLGIGAGAHSHMNGKRWSNPNCIEQYLETATFSRRFPDSNPDQRETIFLGLRLLDGLEVEKFRGFEKEVAELMANNLLMRRNNHYKLTRKGLYLANLVFEKFV
ncbi:MAG: radical SAM family heme chaperone HemW [Candidatus Margulisiibacteriota bacterium]